MFTTGFAQPCTTKRKWLDLLQPFAYLGAGEQSSDSEQNVRAATSRLQSKWMPPSSTAVCPVTVGLLQNSTTCWATSSIDVVAPNSDLSCHVTTNASGAPHEIHVPSIKPGETQFTVTAGASPVVGMVTDCDIVTRGLAGARAGFDRDLQVVTIMSRGVITCRADQDVLEAAEIMGERRVRRLLVLDMSDRPAGILSLGDIAEHASEELAGHILGEIRELRARDALVRPAVATRRWGVS